MAGDRLRQRRQTGATEKDRRELQLCHRLRVIERHGDDPALRRRAMALYLRDVAAMGATNPQQPRGGLYRCRGLDRIVVVLNAQQCCS